MSIVDQDDAFAAELRAIADAEQPSLTLDAATVTHGGRRRRRRRAVRNGALAVLASAAVVVGVAQLADVSVPDTGPAGPTQEPRTFGTGQIAEVAPGVIAANLPETIEVDGATVQDLGFTSRHTRRVGGRETPPMPSVLETRETQFLAFDSEPYPTGYSAALQNVLDGELYQGQTVGWLDDESAERYATNDKSAWSLTSSIGMPVWSHEQFVLGSVPSWLSEPRVVLFSEQGFTLADGSIEHRLEVPTFQALSDDDRLVFAVKVTEEQGEFRGDDPDFLIDAVVYFHSDGVFVGNQCGADGERDCAERYGDTWRAAVERETSTAGDALPHSLDGRALSVTTMTLDDAVLGSPAEVFAPSAELPDALPNGEPLFAMALTDDGHVVASTATPGNFDGDKFVAPERMGLWTPAGFEPFADVSAIPADDPFRYSYFASARGSTVTWVETSSTQGTGLWRIFAHSPDAGTTLVAKAEDGDALGHDFIGDAMPRVLGDRSVWATEDYARDTNALMLVSAPLDGSGPVRVESGAASQPVLGDRGAFFVRGDGTTISVLRDNGVIDDVLQYDFDNVPHVSLTASGDTLVVSVLYSHDDGRRAWIDVIDLATHSVTRVEGANGFAEWTNVCGAYVVWHERSAAGENTVRSTTLLHTASGELTVLDPAGTAGVFACAGDLALWGRVDGPQDQDSATTVLVRIR